MWRKKRVNKLNPKRRKKGIIKSGTNAVVHPSLSSSRPHNAAIIDGIVGRTLANKKYGCWASAATHGPQRNTTHEYYDTKSPFWYILI